MQIEVISTLTSDDEDRVAEALSRWLAELLSSLPIAYALRVDTTSSRVFRRTNIENPEVRQPSSTQNHGPHLQ
jgi:hypothetical protein